MKKIYIKSGIIHGNATWMRGNGKRYFLPEFSHSADTAYTDNPSVVYLFKDWGNHFTYSYDRQFPTLCNALEFLGYGYTHDGIEEYSQTEFGRKVIRVGSHYSDINDNDFNEDC